jgi:lactate dehydrogenase-like 2-hydroxyacid dehydrogenase
MKRGAVLINTCRGPVVDEAALTAALSSGHLGGAGLDVFDPEPIGPDHPFVAMEQVILTPHAASQSVEGAAQLRRRVAEITASVAGAVRLPVIASGGAGNASHVADALGIAQAALLASILHENPQRLASLREEVRELGVPVR